MTRAGRSADSAVRVLAVVPSRLGSRRLPRKPLLRETGRYLFQHVCERVQEAASIDRTILATDSTEILAAADVIRGRRVTTVAKCRYDAEFSGAGYEDTPVVVDGNLVTARTFWDNAPWMREYMRLLNAAQAQQGR